MRVYTRIPADIPSQKGGVGILLGLRFDPPHHELWEGERGVFHGALQGTASLSPGRALGLLI